jgi:hypothetical protein
MGGRPAGAIDRAEHDYAHWEREVDAMVCLLRDEKRRLMRVDELRRGIESLAPDDYDRMSYYARWIHSVVTILTEKGVLTRDEIEARIAGLRGRFAGAEGGR